MFVGSSAGYGNSTASYVTCIGYNTAAPYANATAVGASAAVAGTNSTALGSSAYASTAFTMAFGNTNVTKWVFGLTTVSNTSHALEVGSSSSSTANGNGAYLTTGGTWTNASNRNLKENFTILNSKDILDRICALPITKWNYKGENTANTHIGPMAQDFYKLFHTGNDSLAISTIDPAGVALIGVQELKKENEKLQKEDEKLLKENEDLKLQVEKLNSENTSIKGTTDQLVKEVAEIKSALINSTSQTVDKTSKTISESR